MLLLISKHCTSILLSFSESDLIDNKEIDDLREVGFDSEIVSNASICVTESSLYVENM